MAAPGAAAMAAALLSPALPMQNQPCKHHGSTSGGSVSPGCTHDAPSHPIQQRRIHTTAQGPTDHQLHAEDTTPADQNSPTNRIHPAWLAAVTTFCGKLGANHESALWQDLRQLPWHLLCYAGCTRVQKASPVTQAAPDCLHTMARCIASSIIGTEPRLPQHVHYNHPHTWPGRVAATTPTATTLRSESAAT